ncbi:unnamed protein product [Camellia sinensis]
MRNHIGDPYRRWLARSEVKGFEGEATGNMVVLLFYGLMCHIVIDTLINLMCGIQTLLLLANAPQLYNIQPNRLEQQKLRNDTWMEQTKLVFFYQGKLLAKSATKIKHRDPT